MRNQIDLPAELLSAPFTLTEAKARGVHHGHLRRADVEGVSRGLYRPAGWDFELEAAARALSAATPGAWISHVTAARLRCSCLPPWLSESTELHLSKPRSLPAVRRKGIIGHKVIVAEDEVESVDGIRISTRSRTWLDMAKLLPLNDLVCMGDELIRVPRLALEGRDAPFATLSGLRAMVERHPNLQGIVRAREALELMRVGSDSAPETLLRLAMLDAGIPEPELQLTLRRDDPFSPSADLGFRQRRIAIQYDGGHHLTEAQSLSDRRRNRAFEAAGWTVLVFRKEDLADGFDAATKKIKKALRSAWVDPAVASGFAPAV
ncbi:endonuclease domain-containing protein [Arthrobacter bambusae]|uniref:endonuclease domain-containing protein n=1 Tax=Arthrobacter bambusae TaxID=1338426 RepID=UPI00278255AD|nr:DUF559 domain-containing protein [Arthrobacter bambusae]MDQ0031029.1 hypothetical protein [Arthrobacter bambusae]MDQ0098838.1 hypothetical protein [Arthrobacter bambusae]